MSIALIQHVGRTGRLADRQQPGSVCPDLVDDQDYRLSHCPGYGNPDCMLPRILLGPFAGALVDRWNRKAVIIVADSLIAIATIGIDVPLRNGAGKPLG